MTSKDPNLTAASEVALLYLARQEGGDPNKPTASVSLDLMPHYAGFYKTGSPKEVAARTIQVNVDAKTLEERLRKNLETMGSDGRGIAIGDVLVKDGGLQPQEYGAVLQNVLTNPKSSTLEKINALSDATGPRMGALVGGLFVKEYQDANDKSLSPDQKSLLGIKSFGTTSADFEKTLAQTAASDSSSDVRAMAATMLFSLKEFAANPKEGAALLDQLSAIRQRDIDYNNGGFAAEATAMLTKELTRPLPEQPGQAYSDATDRRLAAIESLNILLAHAASPDAAKATQQQIAASLAEAIRYSSNNQVNKIMEDLLPDNLKQADEKSANSIRKEIISRLHVSNRYSGNLEDQLTGMLKNMPAMMAGADQTTKASYYAALQQIVDKAPQTYSDLRSSAIANIGGLGAQDSIPTLEKTAVSDTSAEVRLSSLKALEQLKDPGLSALVASRTGSGDASAAANSLEGDANVLSYLRDLQYRLIGSKESSAAYSAASADLQKFQTAVNSRYPELKALEGADEQKWLEQHKFNLLIRANFDKDVYDESVGKFSWMGIPTDDGGQSAESKRQDQFNQLAELAKGTTTDALQARQVLASMLNPTGGPIGAAERIKSNYYVPEGSMYMQDWYYNEKTSDWATQAASALAKTAMPGFTGRDYTARLVSMALASNVQGPARDALLKAWHTLGGAQDGMRSIPESMYNYVLTLKP